MPKGFSKHNQGGWKHKPSSIKAMQINRKGLTANGKNPRWMGDNVSYPALHNWIRAHFIRSESCEKCGIIPGLNKIGYSNIHWANKTGKYLRRRSDWICLCVSCHHKYDKISKKRWANYIPSYISCLNCGVQKRVSKTIINRKKYCSKKCMFIHKKYEHRK